MAARKDDAVPAAEAEVAAPRTVSKALSFSTAGLGGIMGWICVHPANTLAVRMNLNVMNAAPGSKLPSFPAFAANVIKNEVIEMNG